MRFAFFLGCTVPARSRNYEMAVRKVAEVLGIEFVDIGDFSCCGFPMKAVSQETTLLMAARNLCLAEEKGLDTICAICSACTSILTEASHELNKHKELRDRVNEKLKEIKHEYKGTIKVRHFNRILYQDIGVDKIKSKIKKDLGAFKIAPHYGCHYLKPSEIYDHFDDPENPKSLRELIEVTGAKSVDYQNYMQCCGGAVIAINEEVSLAVSKEKLDNIKAAGADAITLVCPFCNVMYDSNQKSIEAAFEVQYNIPVLYYPQLLGLAMGFDPKDLGLQMNVVKTKELLSRLEPQGSDG
jgi:heterodisulfide reductase subunit B